MSYKINQEYIDNFKGNTQLYEILKIFKDKEYEDVPLYEAELKILLKGDLKQFRKDLIEKLIVVDDEDTRSEEIFENGTIYPYDPTKADIDIREDPQTIYELAIRKWDQEKLILDPNFQRNFVWKHEQQSQFIESVILNFPLPPLYINKNIEGKYIIVDGRQRITTLRSFLKDDFKLSGLRALPQLNDKNFSDLVDLDETYRTKIEDKKLLIYLIQPSVPLEMVYDIFNRINTGGTQLQRQEIRNCIYMGKSTQLIDRLASQAYFKKAIDYGISPLRKKDQEAVLRFLSFRIFDYGTDYEGSMNDFVEKAMKKINHELNNQRIVELEEEFKRVMNKTYEFFETKNFRVPTGNTRGRINLAVFESVSYFFASKSTEYLDTNKEKIKERFNELIGNQDYYEAIRYSTSDTQRVKTRFNMAMEILEV